MELMRPCSPKCECGLIILLSSSNKAAGEINGHGKEEAGGRVCVGELPCSDSRVQGQPLTEEGKERGGEKEGRKEGGRKGRSHGGMSAPIGGMWSNTQQAYQCAWQYSDG